MDVTLAHPDVDVRASAEPANVGAEKHVGEKQNLLLGRNRVDDFDSVARRAAVVAFSLHVGGGVDVGDDDGAGMLGLPCAKLIGIDGGGERTAGGEIRQENRLLGRED